MKFKAIIFDMDGVLVDTERAYYRWRLNFFAEKGIDISHLPKNYFTGGRMRDLWLGVLRERYDEFDVEQLQTDYVKYRTEHALPYSALLFPDVEPLLKFLKLENIKVGLASSSDRRQIQKFFKETGLKGYFDIVCSGEDFHETKPNPEIYLTAMKKLAVKSDKILVIEDSTIGIASGKAAGATVWGIRDTDFGMDQSEADALFENLDEIQSELESAD